MEYKGDEQPSVNNGGQPHSLEHVTVPASLLPSVLSRLGLEDMTSLSLTGIDAQSSVLKDEEIPVRVAVVRSLGEQKEAIAIASLLTALHDPAWEVRAAAVWELGKFGEQAPLEALVGATDDEDSTVQAAALRTLGLMDGRVPRELFVRALNDSHWQVREIAVLTLGEYGEQAPLESLQARLKDEHVRVRDAARLALEQSHPDALSAISIDPSMITQEPGRDIVFSEREQPGTGPEVEARAAKPLAGDSILTRFSAYIRALQSRVIRDLTGSLVDTRSTLTDQEVNDEIVSQPGETRPLPQQLQTKPRRLRQIGEGVLAALIIMGIVASWLAIEQRLHPSQGSASIPLLSFHDHVSSPAVWSSDNTYLSVLTDSSSTGETVLVWNRATGQVTKHMLHTLWANSLDNKTIFAPEGKHLAFVEVNASNKEGVQVWDVTTWRSIFTKYLSAPNGHYHVLWSPDSTHVVIPGEDGTMQVWNVATGQKLVTCHVPQVDALPITSIISPDGKRVLYGFGPQNTYIVDLTTCKLLTLPTSDSNFTAWSPEGKRFATISLTDASMVQVWDAHTGRNLAIFHLSAPVSDTGLVWTPDGTRLVTSGAEINVLDVAAQRVILHVIPTKFDLLPVWALSPDGERLASLSGANTMQIWDAVTGRKLNAYQSPGNSMTVVAWSPDSRTLATGSTDGAVRVWNAGSSPQTYHGHSARVLNIVWSPDEKSIATGDLDGGLWVWKVD